MVYSENKMFLVAIPHNDVVKLVRAFDTAEEANAYRDKLLEEGEDPEGVRPEMFVKCSPNSVASYGEWLKDQARRQHTPTN